MFLGLVRIYFHYLFIFDPTSLLIGPKIARNMLCNPYVNSYAKASELFLRKSRSHLPGSHIVGAGIWSLVRAEATLKAGENAKGYRR